METRAKFRLCHDEKLDRLRSERRGNKSSRGKFNPNWVRNLSSQHLSTDEISVLSRGLNFAPAPSFIPIPKILSAVDPFLGRMEADAAAEICCEISQVLLRGQVPESNLSVGERKAIKDLKSHDDIVVLPADKGQCTAVMDRSTYDVKILNLLSDVDTYCVVKSDPTGGIERSMNGLLLELHRESKIDGSLYSRIRCTSGRIPLFYGLPQIHRDGVTLCLIVSFCSSPTYALSKHLAGLLSPLVGLTAPSVSTTEDFISSVSGLQKKRSHI